MLAAVLADLSRDWLKELRRLLQLDEGGREKAAPVERVTWAKAPEGPALVRTNGVARTIAESSEPPRGENRRVRLTIDQLERHPESAAEFLRGIGKPIAMDHQGYSVSGGAANSEALE